MLRLSSQTQQSRVRAQLELLLRNAEPGERLPSEPALAKRFDVSRTTIREVMSQLETEGFVQRRQGSGTYVRHQPLLEDESLAPLCRFSDADLQAGTHARHAASSDLCSSAQELSFPPVFTSVKKIGSSPGAACTPADEHFCVLAEDSFPLAFLSKGQRVQLLGSNNTDLRLFLFLATGRAACQDETTISVAQPEDYPFLESLLEDKQHPLLFLSSMCLDNHNEPFISSQIYSEHRLYQVSAEPQDRLNSVIAVIQVDPVSTGVFNGKVPCHR